MELAKNIAIRRAEATPSIIPRIPIGFVSQSIDFLNNSIPNGIVIGAPHEQDIPIKIARNIPIDAWELSQLVNPKSCIIPRNISLIGKAIGGIIILTIIMNIKPAENAINAKKATPKRSGPPPNPMPNRVQKSIWILDSGIRVRA